MKSSYKDTLQNKNSLKGDRYDSYEPKLKQRHRLYGDFVNGMSMGVAAPMMAYQMYTEQNVENFDAFVMIGSTGLAAIFQGFAWKNDSLLCSRIAFLGNCFAGSYMGKTFGKRNRIKMIFQRFSTHIPSLAFSSFLMNLQS